MAKTANLKKCDQPNSDKILYKTFMSGKTDKITFNGETWTADSCKGKTESRIRKAN
jgi:hypothetical protein